MPTSISIFFFFILLLLSSAPYQLTSTRIHIHHRILHQPFFPQDSSPPTQPPSSDQTTKPPQQPKYPFSSTTPPNKPFFPSFPSPPPPPTSSTSSSPSTTFPANISALIFPQPPHKKPISPKLVAIVVILSLFSAAFIISVVLLIYCKKRRNFPTNKTTSRSDSHRLFPANNPIYSDTNNIHKVRRNGPSGVSGTSSEFLYLGTLVNSHGIDGGDGGANVGSAASSSPYQKLGSPELRPLPPLARQNYSREFETVEVGRDRERGTGTGTGTSREDEDEEFYSPRGSSGDKESLGRTGSSSRRVFAGPATEHFESRSSSSSSPSYPTSNSASPSNNSISNSSRSSISKSKSPVFITTLPPPPPPPPPPRPMTPSPPKRKPPSSSPPSSPPERDLLKNPHSNQWPSARINGVSSYSRSGPPPPHPPPPPPPKFWETPIPSVQIHQQQHEEVSRPPVLITPSRPVLFQNSELLQNSESVEKGEEIPKLKLKPLHWDKVRASSDRAMVWDQLKSSSFQ